MLIGRSRVLIEVNFYYKDQRTPMIESYLDSSFLQSKHEYPADPSARQAVDELRSGLAEEFRRMGGTHMQIGRAYPYLESRLPETAELLWALKAHLDPNQQMNPGSIGLGVTGPQTC